MYAIKTYKFQQGQNDQDLLQTEELVLNEIRFLREFKLCNNIVKLEGSYYKQCVDGER